MTADPRDGARGAIGTMDGVRSRPDVPTAAGLALGAVADLLLADPRRGHPVAGFGAAAAALERRVWRNSRAAGAGYALGLVTAAGALGAAADRATRGRPVARTLVTAAATWTVLGGTSLRRAAGGLQRHLTARDLPAARAAPPPPARRGPSRPPAGHRRRALDRARRALARPGGRRPAAAPHRRRPARRTRGAAHPGRPRPERAGRR